MELIQLIRALEKMPSEGVIRHGFRNPMSYRGYYECLAFEPAENVTVKSMLTDAESALGRTFSGYKGGEYKMESYSTCWIAPYGSTGEEIGWSIIQYWRDDANAQNRG